jgi:hypothetical protein
MIVDAMALLSVLGLSLENPWRGYCPMIFTLGPTGEFVLPSLKCFGDLEVF